MSLPENIDPDEKEELARLSGAVSQLFSDNPEDSIPLLPAIRGRKGYQARLKEAAQVLYDLLYVADSTTLPRRAKPSHLTALQFLLHSMAHVASVPVTVKGSRQRFVAISKTTKDFVAGAEYGHLSHAAFTKIVDALDAYESQDTGMPWLEVKAAYHNPTTGKGRRTRIKASQPFCDWMVQQRLIFPWHPKGTTAKSTKSKASSSLLWISDKNEEDDTPFAEPLNRRLFDDEEVLLDLNTSLDDQSIHCQLETYAEYEKLYDFKEGKPRFSLGGNRKIHRQFSLEEGRGGRLYGHWVQSIPPWVRSKLTVDRKPTVELDYSSMQLVLLYAIKGVHLPDCEDLYALPSMIHSRDDMKLVLTRSVGNPTRDKTIASIGLALRDEHRRYSEAEVLYDSFWGHHAAVCTHGDSITEAAWPQLQYLDSRIALRVLGKLLDQGITAIPIHDSFIVQGRYAEVTERVMQEAFQELCPGLSIGIKRTPPRHPL
jgi:hypothetical protein